MSDPWKEIADEWDSPGWKSAAASYHADREPVKVHAPKLVPLNGGSHAPPVNPVTPEPAPDLTEAFTFLGDAPAAPPRELIKGLIPAEGIVVTGGQSSAGKTFMQIHKSICLATTKPYFGRKTIERVGTVFVAAEGRPLLPNRFAAALAKLSIGERLPITWLKALPDFSTPDGIKLFIAQLKALEERYQGDFGVRLGNTVIDTVAACFGMKNEDDNAEATGVCNVMRRIGEEIGCLMSPVHHYAKNADSGLRGASAWKTARSMAVAVSFRQSAIRSSTRVRRARRNGACSTRSTRLSTAAAK